MGTVTRLLDRIARARGQPERCAVVVTPFGFALAGRTIAWQTVSEVWGYKIDLPTTDEAFLEFVAGNERIAVSEEQPGFDALASAMAATFPVTADWRSAVLLPAFACNRTLLYRRS
ncbi:MAG: hypothetical protein J7507_16960 [Pseudoxanthomonas sp.]|nr:hypothetical protein [Pseudoxanthomonas sp.]